MKDFEFPICSVCGMRISVPAAVDVGGTIYCPKHYNTKVLLPLISKVMFTGAIITGILLSIAYNL